MRQAALVISPFASLPRDAGHRRRVHQMTKLLADHGHAVTFLLLAFEDHWAWAHDAEAHAALRAAWDDVIVVHAGDHVGRPPVSGDKHALDEWWDPALQATLANLATRRFFDVVVVHNVWLSKAFDFVHPASVKVLETHDLFWKRIEAFKRLGVPPAFYVTDQDSELFGLARADIVVAIQAAEAHELLGLTPRRVVNVPFYDNKLHDAADPAPALLRDSRKISFGFLASANPFNIHGANVLLAALEREIATNFAPVEIVVGGGVGAHLRTRLPVKRLGQVPTEAGFYANVDYAIAPVFEGTGFKIKTADALALARPLLASAHAAEGAALDASLVCASPQDMASRMAAIALRRPDPRQAQAHVRRAREGLRARAAEGEAHLLSSIGVASRLVMIDLSVFDPEAAHDALRLQSWLGVIRIVAERRAVLLALCDSVRARIGRLLPPAVRAIAHCEVAACLAAWPRCRRIDAAASAVPPLHPNVLWEAAAVRMREAWLETGSGGAALPVDARLLVLRDGPVASGASPLMTALDASDREVVAATLLRLLAAPPPEIAVVCVSAAAPVRQAFLDLCTLRGLAFHGAVDEAALAPPRLPDAARNELARRAADAARFLIQPDSTKEPLCLAA